MNRYAKIIRAVTIALFVVLRAGYAQEDQVRIDGQIGLYGKFNSNINLVDEKKT